MNTPIKGYRTLTDGEIVRINRIKELALRVGYLVQEAFDHPDTDKRWVSIAQTDLQKGFMALTRGVAKPDFF
ncbi:MAG: hypothetical protein HYX63_13430 [Gammaproteobacteria bacterium]|nr:hypothetical protein [Gammaproteobacteria bacterium]